MSESKHTKGPWHVGNFTDDHVKDNIIITGPKETYEGDKRIFDGPPIVHPCMGIMGTSIAQAEANARLIAVSPRMYDYIAEMAEWGSNEAKSILEEINDRTAIAAATKEN